MLYIPPCGLSAIEENIGSTSAEFGTTVTSGGSPHSKGSYAQLIASTARDSYGISIMPSDTVGVRALVDIAIGAAASETIIVPNLMTGNQAGTTLSFGSSSYFFPLFIPAGTRVSSRCQTSSSNWGLKVAIWLLQNPIPGRWCGQRVTAYGADTATSSGVSMSPGNNTYATDVALSASTANKIRYLQIGTDLIDQTADAQLRGLIRLTVDASIIAADLPYYESNVVSSLMYSSTNLILSQMNFNIPAGVSLEISAMRSAAAESRGWAAYGVE